MLGPHWNGFSLPLHLRWLDTELPDTTGATGIDKVERRGADGLAVPCQACTAFLLYPVHFPLDPLMQRLSDQLVTMPGPGCVPF